jgi:site-specific DNA-methyltransferase (cytosine-N4-specific)
MADAAQPDPRVAYSTKYGTMLGGTAERVLTSSLAQPYKGKVQLILTSPPFPLNRKKKYGNLTGDEYRAWLKSFAPLFRQFLKDDGSIVIEMGNAWEPGKPVMSTLALRSLIDFLDAEELFLCQQFVCYNPARLPSPAQWVNVERTRVKDAYTHVWWMSPTPNPKADNRRVLREYSASMDKLLRTKKYNHGRRPSEHKIGETSFLKDHGGAIPPNVLTFTNTHSKDPYLIYCRERRLQPHPARMAIGLAEFFIKFLTSPGQYVLDPFAGSNVTGATAERLKRRWVAVEPQESYIEGSCGRFEMGMLKRV